jgi:hypothetical protein
LLGILNLKCGLLLIEYVAGKRNWRRRNIIPFSKLSGKVYYKEKEIKKKLDEGKGGSH